MLGRIGLLASFAAGSILIQFHPGARNETTTGLVIDNFYYDQPGMLEIGVCFDGTATFISAVQGDGALSPLTGQSVVIEGVVTGDFQDTVGANGDLNGFFIQEEDNQSDSNPLTSEGIFVYQGNNPAVDVQVGDVVRVLGTVVEYATSGGASYTTEISSVSELLVCGTTAVPEPANIGLPVESVSDFERYEGMLVTFPQVLYIAEYSDFDRFGEVVLTATRQVQPTSIFAPGSPEAASLAQVNLLGRITLDDGRSTQYPNPALHPNGSVFDLDNRFRGGDSLQNVTGILDESYGLYRIHPSQGADYLSTNPRPLQPETAGGSLKVAAFNVLNYFTTVDTGAFICGPAQDQECRGADTTEELTRQRAKIIAALSAIDADIVGLIEIENDLAEAAVQDLVNGLNDSLGSGTYAYISSGAVGADVIRVGLIYKPGLVSPVGGYAILDSSVDARFLDTKNRPVLAQTFKEVASGEALTVVINHLKSKGSDCNDVADPDLGDGAGNCNLTRTAAMEALVDWLAGDPTGSGDADFLVIGDLNSYNKEDPVDVLVARGYIDLLDQFLGEDAYSYVFDGQLGYLDHAFASLDLRLQVESAVIWHINADEPDILDYDMTFKQAAQDLLYEPNAFRASDHDPIIVSLALKPVFRYYLPFISR